MIEITFKEFFEDLHPEIGYHELYVMLNGLNEVLYVGISSQNLWGRWFGWNGHIDIGSNYLIGRSPVGEKIVNHLPESWDWKIQLWTFEDCKILCADELNPEGRYTIKMLEPLVIQKLRPSLNIIYNLNPGADHTPKSEKEKKHEAELDRIYREIFDKKSGK